MSYYRQQLENWLKRIRVNTDRVLDIGGASNPARGRVQTYQVDETVFFDNGAEEAKVEYMPFDINLPLEQLPAYYVGNPTIDVKKNSVYNFNVVFCLEVFEYVWNPVQAIKNIYDLMSNDSVAYISFPSIYPVHNPVEIDSLRYTKNVIQKYLKDAGFTDFKITPRIATEGLHALREFYSKEGMHPVRGSDLPYDIGYLVEARKLI